jgi:Putative beta-barrel porin-2, OmpL-like. bbp2
MKKTYGVCIGMLAMGLAVLGAPVSRAQSRMAAGESAGGSETTSAASTSVAAAPAASSPVDLDRRIEALEAELSELKTEMAAKKDAEPSASSAVAATPAVPAQDAKEPEKVTVSSLLGPTSVSGFVDGYYQVNFNHPDQTIYPGAGYRAFDFRDKSINLNMAELILDKAPSADSTTSRIGYHVALGYGDGMDVYGSFDPNGGTQFLLKEGYGSYLAPIGKGLQIDFGKFVTPMGAELVESKDNWNYSRGLLFTWAIPFYHFGLRAKYTVSDKLSVTGFLVNGWNNVTDNNTGKTYGFAIGYTPSSKVSAYVSYLAGPEQGTGTYSFNSNDVWRQTWDAVVSYNPTAKLSFMANFDYARGDRASSVLTTPPIYWTGLAGYIKYALTDNDYVAGRYEYFLDHDGFDMTSSIPSNFLALIPANKFNSDGGLNKLHLNEFTLTYSHTFASYFLTRFEYRRDTSQFPIFALSNFTPGAKYQNSAEIGLIFLFDSRNAK